MKPYSETPNGQLYCGDCIEVMSRLDDGSIDLVLTSPPYNFGMGYDVYDDKGGWDHYFEWLRGVFVECERVLKDGGRLIVNVQPLFSDYIPSHHIISNMLLDIGLLWKAEILWEKNNYNCKYTAWGSWCSPSSPYFKYTWEFIEVFCKGGLKKSGDKENIDIIGDEFKKWVYAKWSMAPERRMKEFGHPAMFPEELVERVLKLFSYRGDLVLDPFNAVANRLGRKYIGMDVSEEYCETATKRIEETHENNSV